VIAVAYNGVLLMRGRAFTEAGGTIALNFTPEDEDKIYALCVAEGAFSANIAPVIPAPPVIPGTAISSGILDNATPWIGVHDPGTPGTSSGTSVFISPPAGRNFNFTYTAQAGHRFSIDWGVDTTSRNFCYDLEIAFPDPSQILNMELDFNQVMADGRTVIFDCQCAHVSQTWEYNAWQPSAIYGDPQTWGVNVYHHIRIFWHRDITGNFTTWDGVEFDGVYKPFNVPPANTAQSLGWAVGHLVINFQIEGSSSSSGTVNAYGRNITLWRW
jgi:hypothetical protein